MFLLNKRQRRLIFTCCALWTSVLIHEQEATEVVIAVEERHHIRHEQHVINACNWHQAMRSIGISVDTEYAIL